MLRFTLYRLALTFLVLLTVAFIAFSLTFISGDPAVAMAGESARPEDVERIRQLYGFDRPFLVQYGEWLFNVLGGDLGRSHYLKEDTVSVLLAHAGVTMTLGSLSLLFAIVVSLLLGVIAATNPGTIIDRIAMGIAVLGQSAPTFFVAFMLIFIFGMVLRMTPISGSDSWAHFILPTIALGYYVTPPIMRLTRAGMLTALSSDYVTMARAKGLPTYKVLFKHALKNAIAPVISVAAVQFGFLLGGSVVIETVFSMRGLGRLAWLSIQRADFAVLQALILLFALIYCLLVFLADILNAWVDPRVRLGGTQ